MTVECDLFKAAAPADALVDLPRPDWSGLVMYYSLTSFDTAARRFVARPYLYIQVPLLGPPGQQPWERTWVTFHFEPEKLFVKRALERFVAAGTPERPMIRSIWKDWPIGMTAEQLLTD